MIRLPEDVKKIISLLGRAGFEAYVVGGCVRDSLLGREPSDWDITTSALPHQVKEVFRRTIDTGIKHGTVTVRMNGKSYEVTTAGAFLLSVSWISISSCFTGSAIAALSEIVALRVDI